MMDDQNQVEQTQSHEENNNESEYANTESTNSTEYENKQPEETAQQETSPSKSWRELRQKAEQAERERDEAFKILQEIQKNQQKAKESTEEPDYSSSLKDDDLVEGKHLSAYEKKLKRIESQLKQYEQKSYETIIENKLKSKYHDFDKVVNAENINELREQYPEIASTLHANSDLYSKAVSAYTLIKRLGIAKEDLYKDDRSQAQINASKPRSSVSVSPQQGDSPLQRANAFADGFTDELKEKLYKEMIDARKKL